MSSQVRIRTPEGVLFSYSLAGPVTRALAVLVDLLVVSALQSMLKLLILLVGVFSIDLAAGAGVVVFYAISICYSMAFEWFGRGQTLGKKFFRLQVMDAQGLRLQAHQVVLRNLLRFVDQIPSFYLFGGVCSLLNPRAQRLGDLAAGTVVVHHPKILEPDLDQLLAGKFNSLRTQPHLAARLRQRVSPEEARLALLALVRRDELDPDARVRLFGELAAHFRAEVPFPAELTDSMPDEQYVRNVVDILFRTRTSRTGAPEAAAALQA